MRRRESHPDAGAAAVEFAIVSVLLLTILFGILQYGYFFFQATGVEHAAREGARLASVGIRSSATVADPCTAFATEVDARAGTGDVTRVRALFTNTDGVAGIARGDTVAVTVFWAPSDFQFPFLPFLGGGTLEETGTTRIERLPASPAAPSNCDRTV